MRSSAARAILCSSALVWVIAFGAACDYGVNSSSPTAPATDTSASTTTPTTTTPTTPTTPSTGLTYVKDIAPIMTSYCLRCHGPSVRDAGYNFSTYAGVMAAVSPVSASARLVRATQPGGTMSSLLSSTAAKTIYDWVVTYKAVQQ